MFNAQQAISNPFGITVFGSAVKRTEPDFATIKASVWSVETKPSDTFAKARKTAHAVQNYLRRAEVADFGTSRMTLSREQQMQNGSWKFIGYKATISFSIRLDNLERVEEIADGLVSSGVNEIGQVSFGTTKIREVRQEARKLAVVAALEKAQNYCDAAGVALGQIVHIEDVDPRTLQAGEVPRGGGAAGAMADGDAAALDPSLLEVAAAVLVSYSFGGR